MENIEKKLDERRKNVCKLLGDKVFESLDTEFTAYSRLHSKMVIALAIVRAPNILSHKLFKKINIYPEETGEKRITKILDEIYGLRGKKIFMDLYNLCWRVAKEYILIDGCFSTRIY